MTKGKTGTAAKTVPKVSHVLASWLPGRYLFLLYSDINSLRAGRWIR